VNLVPYLNTLFDGEIRDLETGTSFKSASEIPNDLDDLLSAWPKADQEEVNRTTKRRAKKILRNMADMVEFKSDRLIIC
jgi:hypothetical protein